VHEDDAKQTKNFMTAKASYISKIFNFKIDRLLILREREESKQLRNHAGTTKKEGTKSKGLERDIMTMT